MDDDTSTLGGRRWLVARRSCGVHSSEEMLYAVCRQATTAADCVDRSFKASVPGEPCSQLACSCSPGLQSIRSCIIQVIQSPAMKLLMQEACVWKETRVGYLSRHSGAVLFERIVLEGHRYFCNNFHLSSEVSGVAYSSTFSKHAVDASAQTIQIRLRIYCGSKTYFAWQSRQGHVLTFWIKSSKKWSEAFVSSQQLIH